MSYVVLVRGQPTEMGTPGLLCFPDADGVPLAMRVLELHDIDNTPLISCIPKGVYHCTPVISVRHGEAWLLSAVEGRSSIMIHSGNWAGQVSRSMLTDTQGCLLIGASIFITRGQYFISQSRQSKNAFNSIMNRKQFKLKVI